MAGNEPSNTFGPVESADETRQAQHGVVNDAPVDVNLNAAMGRMQAMTIANAGNSFQSANDRRTNAADAATERRQILADKQISA
jgi:hypothetical protein